MLSITKQRQETSTGMFNLARDVYLVFISEFSTEDAALNILTEENGLPEKLRERPASFLLKVRCGGVQLFWDSS